MVSLKPIEFVIAHYDEDLSWIDPVASACVIYHKGSSASTPSVPSLTLPNIGREGHTYLYHIIHNYDTLAEISVFLQGRIDDHISIPIGEIDQRARATQPGEVRTFPSLELLSFNEWHGIVHMERWSNVMRSLKSPGQCFNELLDFLSPRDQLPASIAFQPGAMFAVHRDTIRRHPCAFYERLLRELFGGDMAHADPETGHFMERFWLSLWCPEEYVCWNATDIAREQRNALGQLAKGKWLRTLMQAYYEEGRKVTEDSQCSKCSRQSSSEDILVEQRDMVP